MTEDEKGDVRTERYAERFLDLLNNVLGFALDKADCHESLALCLRILNRAVQATLTPEVAAVVDDNEKRLVEDCEEEDLLGLVDFALDSRHSTLEELTPEEAHTRIHNANRAITAVRHGHAADDALIDLRIACLMLMVLVKKDTAPDALARVLARIDCTVSAFEHIDFNVERVSLTKGGSA
jgi:hypothetical protein